MELVIKRSKWLHGEGSLESSLLRSTDEKMCCLGFFALSCGLDKEQITDKLTIEGLYRNQPISMVPEALGFLVDTWPDEIQDRVCRLSSRDAEKLMAYNDTEIGLRVASIFDKDQPMIETDEQREKMIAEIFAEHGVTVRFED